MMCHHPRVKALFVLLSSVSLIGLPANVHASDVCQMSDGFIEKGIGGTGHTDGVGTGGTGGSTPKIGGKDGIGGTGAKPRPSSEEKGLGGTGILAFVSGTIYKHGSICVNGLRITYDATTPVVLNGKQTSPDSLKLGQHVEVYATPSAVAGELVAQSVKIDYALQGPIDSIDPATSSLRVMGERVVVPNLSDWSPYKVGDMVQISGLRDQAGRVQASSIAPSQVTGAASVKGPVKISSDGQIFVGFTPVARTEATEKLKEGDTARITGAWSREALQPQDIVLDNTLPLDKAGYISIEGYWSAPQTPHSPSRVGTYALPIAATTAVENGQRVILSGYVDDDKLEQEQIRSTAATPTFIDPPHLGDASPETKKKDDHEEKRDSKAPHEALTDSAAAAAAAIAPQASPDDDTRDHQSAVSDDKEDDDSSSSKDDGPSDDKNDATETENHDSGGAETETETENGDDHSGTDTSSPDSTDSSDDAESADHDTGDDSASPSESQDAPESEAETETESDSASSEIGDSQETEDADTEDSHDQEDDSTED